MQTKCKQTANCPKPCPFKQSYDIECANGKHWKMDVCNRTHKK